MATAVISDIHGNAEALRSVLSDIASRGIDRIVCLGDVIGYGPEPLACLELVRDNCAWSLLGNHDFGVLYEPTNFNETAEAAAYWTRQQIDEERDADRREGLLDFLSRMRVRVVGSVVDGGPELISVHASPRRPISEYIFPDDTVTSPEKLEMLFERVEWLGQVGHTHVPGVFTDEPDFYPPDELGEHGYRFDEDEKAIINVGSVGQPRDLDPRACYAVFHADRVEYVRVAYDIDKTAELIRTTAALNDWLGERLYEGR